MSHLVFHEKEEGVIINERLDMRSFVLGARPWSSLVQKIQDNFASAAPAVLLDAGRAYGRSALKVEREKDPDLEQLLSREAQAAGWGKISITRKNSHRSYTIKVQSCVFCAEAQDPSHKQVGCFFLRGVISGFASLLFDSRGTVDETCCGTDYCEFALIFLTRS
jgi:predicted hydrocarbon binding protein